MRPQTHIDMMIAQARRALDELKGLQVFGGDALNLSEYTHLFTILPNAPAQAWRVVMTPINPEFTMPLEVKGLPYEMSRVRPIIERVYRNDGNFEVLVIFEQNIEAETHQAQLFITYSGKATFAVEKV